MLDIWGEQMVGWFSSLTFWGRHLMVGTADADIV